MNRSRPYWIVAAFAVLAAGMLGAQPAGCSSNRLAGDLASLATDAPPPCPPMLALDSDEDGELSAEEIETAADSLWAMDIDEDGQISEEELCAGWDGDAPCTDCPCLLLEALDLDDDRVLSQEEVEWAADSLLSLDADEDGRLSAEELCPAAPPPGPVDCPLLQALDLDEDGELSAEEVERAPESLRTLDADEDGTLTCEEICGQWSDDADDAEDEDCECDKCDECGKCGRCDKGDECDEDKSDKCNGNAYGHCRCKHGKGKACGHDKWHGDNCDDCDDGCDLCDCLKDCPIFAALDVYRDCRLSAKEIAWAAESLLTLDGDGILSSDELYHDADGGTDDGCDSCDGED